MSASEAAFWHRQTGQNLPNRTSATGCYPEPCATATGTSVRRTIGGDGKPQTVPFYPRDQRSRRTDMGLLDFSAQIVEAATMESLDPLEFERLRQTIGRLRGDRTLLELSDALPLTPM